MRVLWLSHLVPYPPAGGVVQRSYNLLKEAARRHEVHLVALDQPDIRRSGESLETAREELASFCDTVAVFPIPSEGSRLRWWRLVAVSFLRRRPYDVNWLRSEELRGHVTDLDRAGPAFDLVHVDTLGMAPHARCVSATPFVLNHHNVESQMMEQRARSESHPLKRMYFQREAGKLVRFEREVCSRASMNTVVSALDGKRLREVAGDVPVSVVENGVDTEYFRPEMPAGHGEGGLVFVGGMSWYPNRDAMLYFVRAVWPLLESDDRSRTLTVIGQNPPEEIRALAGESRRVSAPGWVDDIRPQVDAASIYVCPIRRGGGTRLKILDALAMAKPLVATRFAVQGLKLEAGRHYLAADEPEDYVRQIRRLEEDVSLRRRLASEGRALVERRYAWKVIGEHLDRAYRGAVAGAAAEGVDVRA